MWKPATSICKSELCIESQNALACGITVSASAICSRAPTISRRDPSSMARTSPGNWILSVTQRSIWALVRIRAMARDRLLLARLRDAERLGVDLVEKAPPANDQGQPAHPYRGPEWAFGRNSLQRQSDLFEAQSRLGADRLGV